MWAVRLQSVRPVCPTGLTETVGRSLDRTDRRSERVNTHARFCSKLTVDDNDVGVRVGVVRPLTHVATRIALRHVTDSNRGRRAVVIDAVLPAVQTFQQMSLMTEIASQLISFAVPRDLFVLGQRRLIDVDADDAQRTSFRYGDPRRRLRQTVNYNATHAATTL